jgi:hypothetical protein
MIGLQKLVEDIDGLADKIEIIKEGFSMSSAGLKEILNKPQIERPKIPTPQLMLPAPEKKQKTRCQVCRRFVKEGETVCQKCKEKRSE